MEESFHGVSNAGRRGLDPSDDTPSTDDQEPIAAFDGVENIRQPPCRLGCT